MTNGLACHRLEDALDMLAEHGYDGVGLTLDHAHLDPFASGLASRVGRLAGLLDRLRLAVVVETGARFLLDPRRKHEPTLVSAGRERRLDLLRRAVAIGADLGAEAVSFWSGAKPAGMSVGVAWERLVDGCRKLVDMASEQGVVLAFEPEPGMLVDRLDGCEELASAMGDPPNFRLTLDLGHCLCIEDEPVEACVWRGAPRLANVHVEDMRRGVHEHLDFGEGELKLPAALGALREIGYRGLVSVELSRHSHTAHTAVPRAIGLLRDAEQKEALV